jgi:hypothetical protein
MNKDTCRYVYILVLNKSFTLGILNIEDYEDYTYMYFHIFYSCLSTSKSSLHFFVIYLDNHNHHHYHRLGVLNINDYKDYVKEFNDNDNDIY